MLLYPQLIIFAGERINLEAFLHSNKMAFNRIFMKDWNPGMTEYWFYCVVITWTSMDEFPLLAPIQSWELTHVYHSKSLSNQAQVLLRNSSAIQNHWELREIGLELYPQFSCNDNIIVNSPESDTTVCGVSRKANVNVWSGMIDLKVNMAMTVDASV